MEERFYELALKKLAGRTSEDEVRELDDLIGKNPDLREEFDQLALEVPAIKDLIPVVKDAELGVEEIPEFEKNALLIEVREVFDTDEKIIEAESVSLSRWVEL